MRGAISPPRDKDRQRPMTDFSLPARLIDTKHKAYRLEVRIIKTEVGLCIPIRAYKHGRVFELVRVAKSGILVYAEVPNTHH